MRASISLLAGWVLFSSPAISAQEPAPKGAGPDASVLEQDIRDIKGPIEIPAPKSALPWMPIAAGVLATAGAGFAAFRLARRSRKQTAIEVARASFAEARAMVPEGRCREIAYRVSEAVRQFIERRLGVPASRETTEEFLRQLGHRSTAWGSEKRAAFAAFLEACDLAKFSGWQLDHDRMGRLLESGANLVETIEKEEAA